MATQLSRFCLGAALCFWMVGPLQAQEIPFTLDLPFSSQAATPAWLGHPETPATTFATLNLPVQPPNDSSPLLMTIFFQEKSGGFLRIVWQGAQGAQVLSDNFYEGIGMSNQRSLLIAPETLQGGGTIALQGGDTSSGIARIRFQWLENRTSLIAPEIKDNLVISAPGTVQPAQVLDGQPVLAHDPAWNGSFVVVPVTDAAERIEQGVEFSVQLDSLPASGRLALKENGLPWGKHLAIWINQQRVGTITPAVPDLTDGGFLGDPGSSTGYVGWRDGSMFLPVTFFKVGANTLQFAVEDELETPAGNPAPTGADLPPLAVKDVLLQLNYPAPAETPAAVPAPEPATTNAAASTAPPDSTPPDLSTPGATAAPSTTTP